MSKSKRHFYETIECLKPVVSLRSSNLLPFLHFLVCMKSDMQWKAMVVCMRQIHEIHNTSTLFNWYKRMADVYKKYLVEVDGLMLGGQRPGCSP